MRNRRWFPGLRAALALAACAVAFGASAEPWPSKPIRLIVPFPPGGSTDILARPIAQKLSQALGQQVIVDNRGGAGGTIGADLAAKSAPDGYTLLMGHIGTLAVAPSIYPHLAYDPVKSFAPVSMVATVANVLVVNPSVPANTVGELVAYAKAHPGKMSYGSGGNGSAAHIALELFKQRTGTDIVHVPYRGTSPSVTDVVGGQIAMTMTGVPPVLPLIQAGRLKALGVSSLQRVEALPDVPTIAESGVKDFEATQWYGIVAPAGTPEAIVAKLNHELREILGSPEIRERMKSIGAVPSPTTPEEFARHIRTETDRWRAVIQGAHMKAG
ncbi:MAG TPA: tripartite tricarboxylate transporter substrate binding protein [Usitatibacter sp.]|nr:tripartite tricarboxylate transporter substrate binding protein [Usitatibacter sp.]